MDFRHAHHNLDFEIQNSKPHPTTERLEATTSSTMSEPADLSPQVGTTAQAPVEQSNAPIILQTVEHHHFNSLAEVSADLKSLSPKERFEIVNHVAPFDSGA